MKFIGNAIYIEESKSLIISDIHLGLIESLNKKGMLVPLNQSYMIIKSLSSIISKIKKNKKKVKQIIINGDIIHEFTYPPKKIIQEIKDFILNLNKYELIFIKGNHDNILKPFFNEINIKFYEYIILNNILITHGHKKIKNIKENKKIKKIIIGHQHSAISITNKFRSEKYKCYLVGTYYNKEVIVMPSFHNITTGGNILTEKIISPYIPKNINNFEVFIVSDKVYNFGKINNLNL
jgi:uncharacterized protein